MIKANIKALVFDIGGVLFLPKENGREKHLLSSFKEACFLLNEDGFDALSSFDTLFEIYKKSSVGEITKEETKDLMSEILKVSSEQVEESFEKVYRNNTVENTDLYESVLDLKAKGYKLGILSNQFHLSKKVLVPEKYYQEFDALEISCDDGFKKPDERMYLSILEKLNVAPEETVLVDDKQGNLDIAEKLQMRIAHFVSNEQLFSRFEELGVVREDSI